MRSPWGELGQCAEAIFPHFVSQAKCWIARRFSGGIVSSAFKATKVLKQNGINVGFFGANLSQL
jgi:hypothetical protein